MTNSEDDSYSVFELFLLQMIKKELFPSLVKEKKEETHTTKRNDWEKLNREMETLTAQMKFVVKEIERISEGVKKLKTITRKNSFRQEFAPATASAAAPGV